MWDVFISHASENKKDFVSPLAKHLCDVYKVNVWYDDFSLEYGDSLLKSIEKGLQKSRFGIVIISKEFVAKTWTNHEFTTLCTKELLTGKKVIIPIWYNITKEEVAKYNLSLLDRVAIILNGEIDINEISLKIVKIVRPDIYTKIEQIQRLELLIQSSQKVSIKNFNNIPVPPIRHKQLPLIIKAELKLIHNAIKEVDERTYDEYEEDFSRNTNIDREIIITELITAAYLKCIESKKYSKEERLYIYIYIACLGNKDLVSLPLKKEDKEMCKKILEYYLQDIPAEPTVTIHKKPQ